MARSPSGKLQVTLPSETEILLSRVFEAPRRLVWETMTKPEYVQRWWPAMPGMTMLTCTIDFRVGGSYRYLARLANGHEVGFSGEYREIVEPERIVNTEVFDPFPDSPAVCTLVLIENEGRTFYSCRVVHDTKEARDMHIQSGMEEGVILCFEEIDRILTSMQAAA